MDIAASCRAAALDFVNGVAQGWGKREVAEWLVGPYREATHLIHERAPVDARLPAAPVSGARIASILSRSRTQVLAQLEAAVLPRGRVAFVTEMVKSGLVLPIHDDLWTPVDRERVRLRDRVLSLFAADYLMRAGDYVDLFVCPRCESVVFDAMARERGVCATHQSGFVRRGGSVDPRAEVMEKAHR